MEVITLKINVGSIIKATVTGIQNYGFFIKTEKYKGICHITEVSNDFVSDIHEYVKLNEEIYVLVLEVDEENKRIIVSIKDINYKVNKDKNDIVETRKGFLPLKEMLPIWIETKKEEYKLEDN